MPKNTILKNLRYRVVAQHLFWWLLVLFWTSTALATMHEGKPAKIHPEFKPIRDALARSEADIDLIRSRLLIERFFDEKINVEDNIRMIDDLVAQIKQVPLYGDTVEGKLNGIRQYLYTSGQWNDYKPYHYDFDDPLGTSKPENSQLSHYLKTRKGNCVSMPLLVLALGERLGLDMSLAFSPLHLLVRLQHEGHFYNFEATSGGILPDSFYVKEHGITPEALENGIYLRSLTKKEAVAALMERLAKHYSNRSQNNSDFDRAFELTSLMLEQDPKNITAMLIRGNTWRHILNRDLKAFEQKKVRLTPPVKNHFEALLSRNLQWYEKAELLGWRESTKDDEERYLNRVNEARKIYE